MDEAIMNRITGGYSSCVFKNEKDLRSSRPTSFTAVFTGVDEVYCLFAGRLIYMGMYNKLWTINIAVNDHEMMRYINLPYPFGNYTTDVIDENVRLGTVSKQKGLYIEYCTTWKGDSVYPVRICGKMYYKQNPIDIFDGKYAPPSDYRVSGNYVLPSDTIEFTSEEIDSGEWVEEYTEEELANMTGQEELETLEDVEIPDENFDQPAAWFDMDKIDDFEPTQYIRYIQSKQDAQEADDDEEPDEPEEPIDPQPDPDEEPDQDDEGDDNGEA